MRCRGDDGTAVVEAALLSPVFIYLLMGIIEMGLFFQGFVTTSGAVGDGIRQASIIGNRIDADYQIIQSIKTDLKPLTRVNVKVLVVFDPSATSPTDPAAATVPSSCAQSSASTPVSMVDTGNGARCSAYTAITDWSATNKNLYACGGTGFGTRSNGYCPSNRKTAVTGSGGPPGYVGIYLRLEHRYFTGMFGRTKTIEQTIITRLEPQSL